MRYLTVIDYSQVPDANYPQVNVASLNASSVRLIWMVLAGAAYVGFLFLANQTKSAGRLEVALAFCLLAILEPFTQKYALIVLLWPALAAVDLMKDQRVRIFVWIAAVLALVQPLAPGASAQRLLQVLGLDFAAATLLTTTIFVGYAANRNRTLTIR